METIYVDNNATTAVAPEVRDAMLPYFEADYFNPSSMYDPAQGIADAITTARMAVAGAFGNADPKQFLFTSCATESNSTAILGAARANLTRRHIITTAVEHPAVLELGKDLQRNGYDVTFLPVDGDGNLDVSQFISALRPDTLLVSIMHANNETGVVFPVEQLSRLTRETDPSIIFHTDATQSVGKIPIDLADEFGNVDLLSFSGHKLHAPKGIGSLFIRRGVPCRPFLIGGHQESGRRAGTENVPYIIGLARAIELALENHQEVQERIRKLRDRLEQGIEQNIPAVHVNGKAAPRLVNTSNVSCHYVEGEGMLFQLSKEGICASSGSACTSGSLEPSHVLRALNIPFYAIHGSIRFSLSRYNTEQEIDRVVEVFPQVVANLRRASPYWDNHTNLPRPDAATSLATGPR